MPGNPSRPTRTCGVNVRVAAPGPQASPPERAPRRAVRSHAALKAHAAGVGSNRRAYPATSSTRRWMRPLADPESIHTSHALPVGKRTTDHDVHVIDGDLGPMGAHLSGVYLRP